MVKSLRDVYKRQYDRGADWIWCMDDDVYPRQDCLKNLLNNDDDKVGILCPRRIINNQPFVGECIKLNFSSFLKPFHEKETPLSVSYTHLCHFYIPL